MNRPLAIVTLFFVSGCANVYGVTYQGVGEAGRAMEFSRASEARFHEIYARPGVEEASSVAIYLDSLPAELEANGDLIGAAPGSGAELLGSVLVAPELYMPTKEAVVPTLQEAAFAAGADLAFCPQEGTVWRCFLVRRAPPSPSPASASTASL